LTNDAVITAHTAAGVTPWVPIYRELLGELRATLHAATSTVYPSGVDTPGILLRPPQAAERRTT
jgi:hypothetical protein